jgi:hypothetical protein
LRDTLRSSQLAKSVPTTNQAIYGYVKDPADRNKWLVDETAAPIVKG